MKASQPLGNLPTPEEAALLLKNNAVYTSQLEAESRYIKVVRCFVIFIRVKSLLFTVILMAYNHLHLVVRYKKIVS